MAIPRTSTVDPSLLSCFYEGISKPRRLAHGLRRLGEMLDCERVSLRIWDRRGYWASVVEALHVEDRWELRIDDGVQPEPLLRTLIRHVESGQWTRQEQPQLRAPKSGAQEPGECPPREIIFSTRLPLFQAEAVLSLHRQGGDWPDPQAQLAIATDACRALLPALDPIARLQQLSLQVNQQTAMLNGIRMPMLLLDASLRPLAANASARARFCLTARVPAGKIAAALPGVSVSQFAQLIERACAKPAAGGVIEFSASAAKGATYLLVLPRHVLAPGGGHVPAALLVVQGEDDIPLHAHELLQNIYHLTPAEARLALLLLEGQSPGEAASALHLSVSTIRSQLSSILKKTGAQRQSDLLRRLSPLTFLNPAAPLR